jgi:putative protease
MKKIELLAPAGDLEKLIIAIDYGADAVYFGGEMFGLRAGAGNFSIDEIRLGVDYAHAHNRKAYMAINIFAHNADINQLGSYLDEIKDIPIDAYIVSDPGIFLEIRAKLPLAEIHLSTQANTTNYKSAEFWYNQGVKRIVLARELSFAEIKELRAYTPTDLEIEAFVQGAMCISYSGRCLMSNVMADRDANRGACAHPCRWNYHLVEEKRPGEYYPVFEDERGTYVFNSKDLSMLAHIPEIIESGLTSAKIEGRMKSVFYVATVVGIYRRAIDNYYKNPQNYRFDPEALIELKKVSHRNFTTGFYLDKPTDKDQNYLTSSYTREYVFLGIVHSYDPKSQLAVIEQRNRLFLGDTIEVFGPYTDFFSQVITIMLDEGGEAIESAPHAQQMIQIKMDQPVKRNFMLRKLK